MVCVIGIGVDEEGGSAPGGHTGLQETGPNLLVSRGLDFSPDVPGVPGAM